MHILRTGSQRCESWTSDASQKLYRHQNARALGHLIAHNCTHCDCAQKARQKSAKKRPTKASAGAERQRCESLTSDASQKLYLRKNTRASGQVNARNCTHCRLCAKSAPKTRQEAAYKSFCRRRTPTMRIVDVRRLAEALPEEKHARFRAGKCARANAPQMRGKSA